MIFKSLDKDAGAAIPIDVAFEGQSGQAKQRKQGGYGHTLKLEAPSAFTVTMTVRTDPRDNLFLMYAPVD